MSDTQKTNVISSIDWGFHNLAICTTTCNEHEDVDQIKITKCSLHNVLEMSSNKKAKKISDDSMRVIIDKLVNPTDGLWKTNLEISDKILIEKQCGHVSLMIKFSYALFMSLSIHYGSDKVAFVTSSKKTKFVRDHYKVTKRSNISSHVKYRENKKLAETWLTDFLSKYPSCVDPTTKQFIMNLKKKDDIADCFIYCYLGTIEMKNI